MQSIWCSHVFAASKRITALLECDVQEGDIVYLGQWINSTYAPINSIFTLDEAENYNYSELTLHFHSYVEALFTRKIHKTFHGEYKLTAAITEILTTNLPEEAEIEINGKTETLLTDGKGGLSYPSVTDKSNGYNTVFHANYANDNLKLIHVTQGKEESLLSNQHRIDFAKQSCRQFMPLQKMAKVQHNGVLIRYRIRSHILKTALARSQSRLQQIGSCLSTCFTYIVCYDWNKLSYHVGGKI